MSAAVIPAPSGFIAASPVPEAVHAPGTPAEHRCEPRIKARCCTCRQGVVFCEPSTEDIRAIVERRFRCSACVGGRDVQA